MRDQQTHFLNHYLRPYLLETPQKGYTMLVLSLITILFFGFFGVRPAVSSALIVSNNLDRGQEYETTLDKKITALQKAETNLTTEAALLKKLDEELPKEGSFGKLVENLAITASLYNVKLDFYQKTVDQPFAGTSRLSFWIGISGNFASVVQFINGVSDQSRFIKVESMSLQPNTVLGIGNPTPVRATALVSAYAFN